ncbi:MAG: NADH-quinone oxidoreductase subunit NuoK [Planctomycetia bacterium]
MMPFTSPLLAATSMALLQNALIVGAIHFALGLVGILTRRNLIVMFLSAELMLQGISVSLVAWSRHHGDWGGHVLVIFVLTVAACEPAVDTVPTRFPRLTPAGVAPAADDDALLEREQV